MKAQSFRLRRAAMLATLGLCAAAIVASCSVSPRDKYGRIIPTAEELDPAGALYSKSINEANKGGACEEQTVKVLTCFAHKGHGFEGAQGALGRCMIQSGKQEEGLAWMKRAANAGWPDTQKALAKLYAEGKDIPGSDLEAMFWTNLYVRNPQLLSLGVQPDMALAQRLRSNVDVNTQAEATRRANGWTPSFWKSDTELDPDTAAACKTKRGKGDRRQQLIQDDAY